MLKGKNNLRILFLTPAMGVGGVGRQLHKISKSLSSRNHSVHIISLTDIGYFGRQARKNGISVNSLDIKQEILAPFAIWKLRNKLKSFNPHIFCCFAYHANVLGRIVRTIQKVPVVITSIRNERFGGKIRELITKNTIMLDDAVTTNSKTVANDLVKRNIVDEDHIKTIHNAIDISEFQTDDPIDRIEFNVSNDCFLWITVGRLNEQKDHQTLLHAISQIDIEPIPNVLIVGAGPQESQLKELAEGLQINNQVHFIGERNDIPSLLAASDAFVLSSAWEGLPNVVMEAHAAGLPVVSTDVGGVSELVADKETGYIVPEQDPKQLALAMGKMMELSQAEREKMGECGKRHIRMNFTINKITDDWERLFLGILHDKTNAI